MEAGSSQSHAGLRNEATTSDQPTMTRVGSAAIHRINPMMPILADWYARRYLLKFYAKLGREEGRASKPSSDGVYGAGLRSPLRQLLLLRQPRQVRQGPPQLRIGREVPFQRMRGLEREAV